MLRHQMDVARIRLPMDSSLLFLHTSLDLFSPQGLYLTINPPFFPWGLIPPGIEIDPHLFPPLFSGPGGLTPIQPVVLWFPRLAPR